MNKQNKFSSVFTPRSSSLCHAGLWPSSSADWCSDPNLWRPGLSVHRHLDSGWGGGRPQTGSGHRHQHPLPHSARPSTTTCLQVHEGLFLFIVLGRDAGWLTCCLKISAHTVYFNCSFESVFFLCSPYSYRLPWLGAMAAPMLEQRSHWASTMATLTSCHGRVNLSWCMILCAERVRLPVSQMWINTWPWWWHCKRTFSAGETGSVATLAQSYSNSIFGCPERLLPSILQLFWVSAAHSSCLFLWSHCINRV